VGVLKEKHFLIKFAANFVKFPQKCTGCYNKHSETEHCGSPSYLSSIATSKMATLVTNIQDDADHFL